MCLCMCWVQDGNLKAANASELQGKYNVVHLWLTWSVLSFSDRLIAVINDSLSQPLVDHKASHLVHLVQV